MKRRLSRITVCLLLGALSTVAVAWGLVYFGPEPASVMSAGELPARPGEPVWKFGIFTGAGVVRIVSWCDSRAYTSFAHTVTQFRNAPHWSRVGGAPQIDRQDLFSLPPPLVEDARGWPFVALASTIHGRAVLGDVLADTVETGIRPAWSRAKSDALHPSILNEQVLPLRPLVAGFALDALFYGAIWFGVLLGIETLHRAYRRWRGLCPRCAYDLRGDHEAGCPECGWNRAE